MNSKILLAFIGGAFLASGIVYMAVRPDSSAKPATAVVTSAPVQSESASSQPEAEAAPSQSSRDDAGEPRRSRVRADKPSPTYARKEEVARITPPAAPVQAAPPAEPPQQQPAPQFQPAQAEPAPVQAPPPAPAPPPQPHSVTIPAGTSLDVRVGETISTQKNKAGDTFLATLSQPIVVDGFVIAERGARAEGRIVEADKAGKVKGVSHLTVELTKVSTSDGQSVPIRTVSYIKEGQSSMKKDAAKVGIGAVLGAAIGAMAGGGKGAAIGSGVGGAAGAGDVMMTRGPDTSIPVETKITFRLQEAVTITERL